MLIRFWKTRLTTCCLPNDHLHKIGKMKKFIYYFLLTVTVLIVALFVSWAVYCCVYRQFFYVQPSGPVLPGGMGPIFSSGVWLLVAALAGFIGGGLLRWLNYDGKQKSCSGGEEG